MEGAVLGLSVIMGASNLYVALILKHKNTIFQT